MRMHIYILCLCDNRMALTNVSLHTFTLSLLIVYGFLPFLLAISCPHSMVGFHYHDVAVAPTRHEQLVHTDNNARHITQYTSHVNLCPFYLDFFSSIFVYSGLFAPSSSIRYAFHLSHTRSTRSFSCVSNTCNGTTQF